MESYIPRSGHYVVLVARQTPQVQPPPLASSAMLTIPVPRSSILPSKMQWLEDMEDLTAMERLLAMRKCFRTLQQYPNDFLYHFSRAPHLLYSYQFCLTRISTVFTGRASMDALEDLPTLFEELKGPSRPCPEVLLDNLQHNANFCTIFPSISFTTPKWLTCVASALPDVYRHVYKESPETWQPAAAQDIEGLGDIPNGAGFVIIYPTLRHFCYNSFCTGHSPTHPPLPCTARITVAPIPLDKKDMRMVRNPSYHPL